MTDLTPKEEAHVRTALRSLRRQCGGWAPVAKALRYQYDSVEKIARGGRSVTASIAIRVARFAGVSFDDLLAGKFPEPGTCPHCGHRPDTIGVAEDQ